MTPKRRPHAYQRLQAGRPIKGLKYTTSSGLATRQGRPPEWRKQTLRRKETWILLRNSLRGELEEELEDANKMLECCNPLLGQELRRSANYPDALVKSILQAI